MNEAIKEIFGKIKAGKDEIVKICVESLNAAEIKEKLQSFPNSITDEDAEQLSRFFASVVDLSDEELAAVVGGKYTGKGRISLYGKRKL